MLLTMRRQNEVISSQQHSTAVTTTSTATPSPPAAAAAPTATQPASGLELVPTTPTTPQDSLNTPTTPLSRNPLQFAAPPVPPPIAVPGVTAAAPAFGYYNSNNVGVAAAPATASYLHQPSTADKDSAAHSVELDEYVDILQVQQLLLDSSAAAAAAANQNVSNTYQEQQQQHQQQQQQQQQLQSLAKPRPRINLQKASDYAAQLAQAAETSSTASRRVLLDYPNPYLYGNHYHHTPPSEDLVALWFGSNGAGGVAPGTPSAAMIMEGLETLVAPTHHAFLLTETAAAAHFNVLSFDTCLFKTSTAQSSSPSAASYLSAAQFGGGSALGAASSSSTVASSSGQTLLHYTTAASHNHNNNNSNNNSNNNNSVLRARNQTATPTQGGSPGNVAAQPIAGSAAAASSGRSSASHLSLLNTSQQSPVTATEHGVAVEAKQLIEALPGDLNTPVTTSSDIPSFFGPSTVVEPPPITATDYVMIIFEDHLPNFIATPLLEAQFASM
ncbi:protein couch potato isoform X5 [Drosophila novamexicana]|uniref:protein couch potato isoform X5 n=1 Tax=Drosophila novamexicana TaxID=47314 RepID=UPI0011E59147|nr:protein couch potato isoform X5 [Drosophila novamexicana]